MAPSPNRQFGQGHSYGSPTRTHIGSFAASSPIAEASIARDLEDEPDDDPFEDSDDDEISGSEASTVRAAHHHTSSEPPATGLYRRTSFATAGPRAIVVPNMPSPDRAHLPKTEREEAREQERSLLRDNNVIPPKHPLNGERSDSIAGRLGRRLPLPGIPVGARKVVRPGEESEVDGTAVDASETTALLGNPEEPYGGQDTAENIDRKWEEAVAAGIIKTTWQREAKVIGKYSAPLVATFMLQYSLTVASVFTVGHLGKIELGAVSLASMTAGITGYAVYQGLVTSLDTLCAQAYGSGKKKLVGLQMQRMIYFLWLITIPIAVIWFSAEAILRRIVPEPEVAVLAGRYLKVLIIGAPGYACFEAGKRFVQAQGLFSASLYVLLFCAPLNAFMNWLFVWQFKWGFIGAPIAVVITDTLLPIALFLYVRFVNGRACWNGFTTRALHNWGPMIRLALPGLVMVEAEWLAFEILTLAASYFGTTHLAAQSVLSTLNGITFQIPFPISIAASTRIANLIGATLSTAARTSAKVAFVAAVFVGSLNVILLSTLRNYIPQLFTSDPDVIALVAHILPLCAAFQLFDALAANCNGILRGLGRQEVGGYVQLFCYYGVAIPISMGTAFGLHWDLLGLWAGVAVALFLVTVIEAVFLWRTSWERSVEDAKRRNALA